MGEGLEFTFWCLAIVGSGVFLFRLVMLLIGVGHDIGDGGGADLDGGGGDAGDHGDDSSSAFTLLSIQSLAALTMGTGWMGLAGLHSFALAPPAALGAGVLFGLALVYALGWMLKRTRLLESSGNLDVTQAVGTTGVVYLGIPESGAGQVQITVQGRLATLDARTRGSEIPTGTRIRVLSVDPSGVLVVARV